jgi:hypothetical protein
MTNVSLFPKVWLWKRVTKANTPLPEKSSSYDISSSHNDKRGCDCKGSFKSRERKIMKHIEDYTGSTAVRERPNQKSGSGKSDADQAEMMKKMEAAGTPGPAHKALEAFVGNWKAEVKSWCEPGGQAQMSQGTAKVKWILNGRFLEEEFHGEMMGKPFTGRTTMGYDNTKQTYNTVWITDTQTSLFISEGKGENGNKVITLEGKADCPATGRKNMSIKSVYRVINHDKHVFEMFNDGEKSLEVTYTRQ